MALPAPIQQATKVVLHPIAQDNNRISNRLPQAQPQAAPTTLAVTETHQLVTNLLGGGTIFVPLSGISYYFEFLGTLGGIPNNFAGLGVRAVLGGQPRSQIIHVQGTGLRFGTLVFDSLEVTNLDPVNSCRFTVDVGGGIPNGSYDEYLDKRVIISNSGGSITVNTAVGVNLAVANGLSGIVGFKTRVPAWADSLAANTTQDVTDAAGVWGTRRKTIIFSNDDPAAILTVFDSNSNIIGSIQPSTAWTTDTGGDIKLRNPTAGPVTCHIGEVYYL